MNVADLVIAVVLLIGLLSGLARGFVRCLLGLVALVVGILVAAGFHELVAETAFSFLPGDHAPKIVSFVVIFLVVVLLIGLVARIIAKTLKLATLGWLDGLLGAILGLATAAVVAGVLLLLLVMAGLGGHDFLVESRLAPRVLGVTDAIVQVLPADAREAVEEHYRTLRTKWDEEAARRGSRAGAPEDGEGEAEGGSGRSSGPL